MPPIEYHILTPVKNAIGKCAAIARYVLWGCALLALAELVLLPLRLPLAAILSGMVSGALLALGIALVAVLAAWGHTVLLAGQGMMLSRWMLNIGALLSPLLPVCWIYTICTGVSLLYRQGELPIILTVLMFFAALVNIPRMAAAPWQLQVRIVLLPLLLLLAYCSDAPGLLIFSVAFKLLAAWISTAPLSLLADFAPRIISMPGKD